MMLIIDPSLCSYLASVEGKQSCIEPIHCQIKSVKEKTYTQRLPMKSVSTLYTSLREQ